MNLHIIHITKGSYHWRIILPYTYIKENYKDINITFQPITDNIIKANDDIRNADIIIMQGLIGWKVINMVRNNRKSTTPIILDIDDLNHKVNKKNPAAKQLNKKSTKEEFLIGCTLADGIITSTEYLRKSLLKYNKNIFVINNYVNMITWNEALKYKEENKIKDEYIRLGWFGGDSHQMDLAQNILPIIDLLKKYNNLKYVICGADPFKWSEFMEVADKIEYYPWTTTEDYWKNLSNIDIGLIPLELDNAFNKCKSNIKWLEFSLLKTPCIITKEKPYIDAEQSSLMLDDNNYNTWYNAIEYMINNKDKQEKYANDSYSKVVNNYSLQNKADTIIDTLKQIMEKSNDA